MRSTDSDTDCLSPAQRAGLSHVEDLVHRQEVITRPRVSEALQRAGCRTETYDETMECVRVPARVVIEFHPDRFGLKSTTVAEALLAERVYRNQFETGLSNGSLSAFAGGPRDTWERTLFGGAYHGEGVTSAERPKYGALELVRYPDGPIPRFGSCYFVLQPNVSGRTSFTFAGSEDPRATERLGHWSHGQRHGGLVRGDRRRRDGRSTVAAVSCPNARRAESDRPSPPGRF